MRPGSSLGSLCLLIVASCSNGSASAVDDDSETGGGTGSTSDAEDTGSTDSETGDESGDGDWPECVEPEDVPSVWGSIQAPDWPYADAPAVEEGTCSIDEIEYVENGGGVVVGFLQLTCVPLDGMERLVELQVGGQQAHEGRLDAFVGLSDVQLQFETWAPYAELHHHEVRLRDANGRLLLATVVEERPAPDAGGWDGTVVGVVGGWEQADWFAPFDSFVLRDQLCPDEDSAFTGFAPDGTARRLGIEVQVEGESELILHRTQRKGIETSEGTYDVIVGTAWRLIETTCVDCEPVFAAFMVVAVD